MSKDLSHETVPTLVFTYKGVVHVPHYTRPGFYVGPGGGMVRLESLRFLELPSHVINMWPREWALKEKVQGDHL